jgi:membrane-associated protease RseP (regulator of RpoE activity)
MLEHLLSFLAIILGYSILVFLLHKKGILKKYNISFMGPALMWRTKRGRNLLKRLAKKKKFWKAFGDIGIAFCFIVMLFMTIMLIWQAWFVSGFTPEEKESLPGPEVAVIIPGVNPILPLEYIGYIIIALIVAVVVHEFSHGILTITSNLKVKSLGLLYLIIPIGAFCEPDEKELKKAKTKPRMRIFAAGPTSNFAVVLVSIFLFSSFMSFVEPAGEGAIVFMVDKDSPAERIGIGTGCIITSINNTQVSNFLDYYRIMNGTKAYQTINITFVKGNKVYTRQALLGDKYLERAKRRDVYIPDNRSKGKGYLGIQSLLRNEAFANQLSILKNPFNRFPSSFLTFYVIPLTGYFEGYNPIVSPFTNSYIISGIFSFVPSQIFWIIVNALYWIFWLNFAVVLFNVLPMVPLDGGFLFNDALDFFVKRFKKGLTREQREKIVRNVSLALSLTILILILFPWMVKYL